LYRATLSFSRLALATSFGLAKPSSSIRSSTTLRLTRLAVLAVGLYFSGEAMVPASDAASERVRNLTDLFPK
jgi:hypothetical protein